MTDEELLASLLGLSIRCPYGSCVPSCPFIPYQTQPLKKSYVALSAMPRDERESLLQHHHACLRELESG